MAPAIPTWYRLFFLYIEPLSALAGAYYAAFRPADYLADLTLGALTRTPPTPAPTQTNMALLQLANLYLLFALNEHFVLSSTNSLVTWRRLLVGLLIADFGHLVTMARREVASSGAFGSGTRWRGAVLDSCMQGRRQGCASSLGWGCKWEYVGLCLGTFAAHGM